MLYLDSDIVVNASLTDLFNIDMRDHPIAAVEDYFLSNKKISHWYKMDIPAELKSCIFLQRRGNFLNHILMQV